MWGGVVGLAGGENIALGKVDNWGPLSPEYVLAQDPGVVIIPGSGWVGRDQAVLMGCGVTADTTRERLRPYTERAGWSGLDAIKQGEVHVLYHGGARTLYDYAFLQYVAKVLHPDAFADVDPAQNHRRFYETYLPVAADGTFMVRLD